MAPLSLKLWSWRPSPFSSPTSRARPSCSGGSVTPTPGCSQSTMRSSEPALSLTGGDEIDTAGDGFFAVFSSPRESLAAATQMQRSLAAHSWPGEERVRVRIGVHTGEAAKEEAVGLVRPRCPSRRMHCRGRLRRPNSRLSIDGRDRGGRFPMALATRPWPSPAEDLGEPEQIFQLEVSDLPIDFGPLRSLDNPELPNNLPSSPSEFVGRVGELENVRNLVRSSRLVTLAGAGGCGKTCLALQVAVDLLDGSGGRRLARRFLAGFQCRPGARYPRLDARLANTSRRTASRVDRPHPPRADHSPRARELRARHRCLRQTGRRHRTLLVQMFTCLRPRSNHSASTANTSTESRRSHC